MHSISVSVSPRSETGMDETAPLRVTAPENLFLFISENIVKMGMVAQHLRGRNGDQEVSCQPGLYKTQCHKKIGRAHV